MAKDILINTIQALVPNDWTNDYWPEYYLYDKLEKHCDESITYRDIIGNTRWYCKHENLCRRNIPNE